MSSAVANGVGEAAQQSRQRPLLLAFIALMAFASSSNGVKATEENRYIVIKPTKDPGKR